jgi:hypothetical protein
METLIRKYIRNRAGDKIGVIMADKSKLSTMKYHVGWSLTNKKDTFNKELGVEIAKGRITKAQTIGEVIGGANIPICVTKELPEFLERCARFYK